MGPGPEPQPFHLSSAGTLTRCCVDVTTCTTAQRPVLTLSRVAWSSFLRDCKVFFSWFGFFWSTPASGREQAGVRCWPSKAVVQWEAGSPKRPALSGAHTYLLVRTHCLCKGSSDSCWDFPISCQYIHVSSEGNSNRRETCL